MDDNATGTTTLNLTGTRTPGAIAITNSSLNYTIGGAGALAGTAGLVKDGSKTLVLQNLGENTFAGDVVVAGGKLQLAGAAHRLPTYALVQFGDVAGAELDLNNLDQALAAIDGGGLAGGNITLGSGKLTLDGGAGTFNGVISGAGGLLKNGTGTQVLGNANLYSGGTLVAAGRITVANQSGSGIGSGSLTVGTNAFFRFGAAAAGGSIAAATITNNGTVEFDRTDDFTLAQTIVGDGGVTKLNVNTVNLPNANAFTNNVTIVNGALRVSHPGALGTAGGYTYVQNGIDARLELTGGITLAEPLQLACKQNASGNAPALVSLSGTNLVTGRLDAVGGGTFWTFKVDADQLTLTGPLTNINTSNTRSVRLRGVAVGDFRGSIYNASGNASLTGLIKEESGTWLLSGNNFYTGPTVINEGTLLINGSIGGGSVAVNGGVLGGTGTIQVPTTINGAGTLAPGTSIGTLAINHTLSLGGTTIMEVSHSAADKVTGITTLTLGGTLQVVVNAPLTGGEVFQLFQAGTITGDFAFYDLPTLPGSLGWDYSQVPLNGTLRVTGGAPPPPKIGTVSIAGGSLSITGSGGTPGADYYILTSADVALPAANWTPVATNSFDGSGNFSWSAPVDPAKPRLFYMLQVP